MGVYTGLLFLDGHVAQPELARSLASASSAPPAPSPGADRRVTGEQGVPGVYRRGAIVSVCGAATLSPFR